jgi:hypothetical protein
MESVMAKHLTDKEAEASARMCGWVETKCGAVTFVEQPEHGWMAPDWQAACDHDYDGSPAYKKWLAALAAKLDA